MHEPKAIYFFKVGGIKGGADLNQELKVCTGGGRGGFDKQPSKVVERDKKVRE